MKKPPLKIKDCIEYMESKDYNFIEYYPRQKWFRSDPNSCLAICGSGLYGFKKKGPPYSKSDMVILDNDNLVVLVWTMTIKELRQFVEGKHT